LLTNDRSLPPTQVLAAHKGQARVEKRFEQIKSVHEIAPVFLKNEARIEALFTLYFLALLVQALIQRPCGAKASRNCRCIRKAACRRPTTEQILRLFSLAERHTLLAGGLPVQVFEPELNPLQIQVLKLAGVGVAESRADDQTRPEPLGNSGDMRSPICGM
jgi:hypothetical protein